MSETVRAAIDREIAALARVVDAPTLDLGWGRDLACVTELSPTLAEVDPLEPRGIGEAALRRLITPRGALPGDRDYGLDVRSFLNRGVPLAELRDVAGLVRVELTKDDRIAEVTVDVTMPSAGALRFAMQIVPADPALEPFALIFGVTSSDVVTEAIG